MTILLLYLISYSYDLNTNMHPKPQILPIEKNGIFLRLVKVWPSHASSSKAGKPSKQGLIDCIFWSFLHPTWMGVPVVIDGRCGASDLR